MSRWRTRAGCHFRAVADRYPRAGRGASHVDGAAVEFGDNCVPHFEVADADAEFERVSELAPEVVHGIVDVDGYRCLQVRDTEGNVVEIFGVDSA